MSESNIISQGFTMISLIGATIFIANAALHTAQIL